MELSSYHQYYLRQFLRHYSNLLNYPLCGVGLHAYLQGDVVQQLRHVYPNNTEFSFKLQELGKLIEFHRQLDSTAFCASQNISQIEQRILWLLGLRFLALLPMMALTIVSVPSTSRFCFLLDNALHEGIRHSNQLYGKISEFNAECSLQACHLLFTLSGQQAPFLLTVSESCHEIWLNLRSPLYHQVSGQPYKFILSPHLRNTLEMRKIWQNDYFESNLKYKKEYKAEYCRR
jgi:hypothetical protein